MTVDRCLTLGTDDLYREAGYVALSRGRTANILYAVGNRGIDDDLTHVPQHDATDPVDLVRDALGRQAAKQLAIETVGSGDYSLAELSSDPDQPSPIDHLGFGH